MNAPQNAAKMARFEIAGIELRCSARNESLVRDAFRDFPGFLVAKPSEDVIEIDWKMYQSADEDSREAMHLILEAADILTREEEGSYGIYVKDDPKGRYYWGPAIHADRLFFTKENLETAHDYMCEVLPAIAELDHAANLQMFGHDVSRQPLPDLEIRLCLSAARFEAVEPVAV